MRASVLLCTFKNRKVDYLSARRRRMFYNVVEWFERTALRAPDSVAIQTTERQITYKALRNQSAAIAHRLLAAGAGENKPVICFLPASPDAMASFLAVIYSGNYYVPLYPDNPRLRIRRILESTKAKVVVTSRAYEDVLKSVAPLESRIVCVEDAVGQTGRSIEPPSAYKARIDLDPVYAVACCGRQSHRAVHGGPRLDVPQ